MSSHSIGGLKQAAKAISSSLSLEAALETLALGESSENANLTLAQIAETFATSDGVGDRGHLLAVLACLRRRTSPGGEAVAGNIDEGSGQATDAAAARKISDFTARSIAPIVEGPDDEDNGYHPTNEDRQRDVDTATSRCRPLGEAGLAIFASLLKNATHSSSPAAHTLSTQALITAVAYHDPQNPWSRSAGLAAHASSILQEAFGGVELKKAKAGFIVEVVLKEYLRSLFSKSRPAAVTASGRKAEFADDTDAQQALSRETRAIKPWKYTDLRAIPVFAWTVMEADEELISQQWHRFTPVLLALLDDGATDVRARGLRLLVTFLSKVPGKTLTDTGLDSVFQEAVFPTLLFLPSVTPEAEALQLQDPAYEALTALSRIDQGAKKGREGGLSTEGARAPNLKLLDKILRDGVFAAFFFARDYIRIVEVLARQAGVIVGAMGIHAVKHLKDLVPMLASIMSDPFATAHPASLRSAIAALQAVIVNCWPRLGHPPWRDEIIKALVVCWLRVQDDSDKDTEDTSRNLICDDLATTARLVSAVVQSAATAPKPPGDSSAPSADMDELVAPLVAKEPLLRGLFSSAATASS